MWSGKARKVAPKDITSLVLKVCQGMPLISVSLSLKTLKASPS